MTIRSQIESIFKGKAFERPLFYSYEGGLRFELSEGGSYINRFLTANQKAGEICHAIFKQQETATVCLRFYGSKKLLGSLSMFRELKELNILVTQNSEYWSEPDEADDDFYSHYIAFNVSKETIKTLLWCACASDFGHIKPNPRVAVYFFNFDQEVVAFPYDDRGMDVVGNNHSFLKTIYTELNQYLLDYDRESMEATFNERS
ncbi:uncharacterized protein DUF3885 [Alteromonadaceae bacterium 2753L.S.0a.02]|nr:uncharacterized protein DUF3885 [Alteromonadaceae bacterium 2753L.S.0a.02]